MAARAIASSQFAEQHFSSQVVVNPLSAPLLIGLAQALRIDGVEHVRLFTQSVTDAPAEIWHQRAHVNHMPHRSASRNQRNCIATQRVPDEHDIVVASVERAQHTTSA